MTEPIANGFDFEPLKDGNILIEFFGDDGKTFNTQVVTQEVLRSMPLVAMLTMVVMQEGVAALKKLMDKQNKDGSQDAF